MFYGTDNILWIILYDRSKHGEYSTKYYQSYVTLLWMRIMLYFLDCETCCVQYSFHLVNLVCYDFNTCWGLVQCNVKAMSCQDKACWCLKTSRCRSHQNFIQPPSYPLIKTLHFMVMTILVAWFKDLPFCELHIEGFWFDLIWLD